MPPVVIENPILNSPFDEPTRHFQFDDKLSITATIAGMRRPSSYFVPIPDSKKKGKQTLLFEDSPEETKHESDHVNKIRASVRAWRKRG